MHSKRLLIRVITRILYAGGLIFLIAGLLLSAISTSVLAEGGPSLDMAAAPTSSTPPNCYCTTSTPVGTKPAPTKTQESGTPEPTHQGLAFNLSSICGYTFDNYELWKVANHTNSDAKFEWKVVGTNESGSGTVPANGVTYFKSSAGLKTVRLYVDNKVVDTESCLAPCKQELQLSYVCTENGLVWHANNPNTFAVDYTVQVDHKAAGKGKINANSNVTIATTASGAHTVELTWTDTRPESHTVTLTSPVNSCIGTGSTVTPTPTYTQTIPAEIITITPTVTETKPGPTHTATVTPTVTETQPGPTHTATSTPTITETPPPVVITKIVTLTPTITETPPPVIVTLTPTITETPPPVIVTRIVTLTPTITETAPPAVVTLTPTVTQTVPPLIVTRIVTATPAAGFIITPTVETPTPGPSLTPTETSTATQIVTLAPPVVTITSTPVLIPVTGVDLTRPIGANSLSLFGGLLTNIGLFTLGLALALTGISSQLKD